MNPLNPLQPYFDFVDGRKKYKIYEFISFGYMCMARNM